MISITKSENVFNKHSKNIQDIGLLKITREYKDNRGEKVYKNSRFEINKKTSFYHSEELLIRIIRDKGLSPIGLKIFLFVLGNLNPDNDWIVLKRKEISDKFKIPERTISEGMNQLIELDILARHRPTKNGYRYWINTKYLFNGNRKKYYEIHFPGKIWEKT